MARILIAGIGNIFCGDDAFGVEVAQRLARRSLPGSIRVVDFGIRGYDLYRALGDGYDAAILLDAASRGGSPGSLYVIKPDMPTGQQAVSHDPLRHGIEMHSLDPATIISAIAGMEIAPKRLLILGCEPRNCGSWDEPVAEISPEVATAIDKAVDMAHRLALDLLREFAADADADIEPSDNRITLRGRS